MTEPLPDLPPERTGELRVLAEITAMQQYADRRTPADPEFMDEATLAVAAQAVYLDPEDYVVLWSPPMMGQRFPLTEPLLSRELAERELVHQRERLARLIRTVPHLLVVQVKDLDGQALQDVG